MSRHPTNASAVGLWIRFRSRPSAVAGLVVVATIAVAVVLGPLLLPLRPEQANPSDVLLAPAWGHPFGTDHLGRDLLARTLAGGRVTLLIALVSSLLAIWLGTITGFLAGWSSGIVGAAADRVVRALHRFPDLFLVVLISLLVGRSPLAMTIALACVAWIDAAHATRGEVKTIRGSAFLQSARAQGFTRLRLISRDVFPNLMVPILRSLSSRISAIVVIESTLSFLGLGVSRPVTSWGGLASEGWPMLSFHPYVVLFPLLALVATVAGFNLIADGIRGTS